jgi:hypothetical protein
MAVAEREKALSNEEVMEQSHALEPLVTEEGGLCVYLTIPKQLIRDGIGIAAGLAVTKAVRAKRLQMEEEHAIRI